MTTVTIADVERIEKKLATAKEAKARLEGAQASEREAWERNWGIKTPEELQASIDKLKLQAETLGQKCQERYTEILALIPAEA